MATIASLGATRTAQTLPKAPTGITGLYEIIDSFEQLISATQPDFVPYYEQLQALPAIPAGQVLDTDKVYTRGTGEGWATDADF